MTNLFQRSIFRYGVAASSATIVVATAWLFFDGPVRYLLLGMAGVELLVVPWVLKRVGEAAEEETSETDGVEL
mgnify:CR=1 FL=1